MSDEPDRVESEPSLEWATSDELLNELATRSRAFIFVWQRDEQGNAGRSTQDLHWHGGIFAAHGLAVYAGRCTAVAIKELANGQNME